MSPSVVPRGKAQAKKNMHLLGQQKRKVCFLINGSWDRICNLDNQIFISSVTHFWSAKFQFILERNWWVFVYLIFRPMYSENKILRMSKRLDLQFSSPAFSEHAFCKNSKQIKTESKRPQWSELWARSIPLAYMFVECCNRAPQVQPHFEECRLRNNLIFGMLYSRRHIGRWLKAISWFFATLSNVSKQNFISGAYTMEVFLALLVKKIVPENCSDVRYFWWEWFDLD